MPKTRVPPLREGNTEQEPLFNVRLKRRTIHWSETAEYGAAKNKKPRNAASSVTDWKPMQPFEGTDGNTIFGNPLPTPALPKAQIPRLAGIEGGQETKAFENSTGTDSSSEVQSNSTVTTTGKIQIVRVNSQKSIIFNNQSDSTVMAPPQLKLTAGKSKTLQTQSDTKVTSTPNAATEGNSISSETQSDSRVDSTPNVKIVTLDKTKEQKTQSTATKPDKIAIPRITPQVKKIVRSTNFVALTPNQTLSTISRSRDAPTQSQPISLTTLQAQQVSTLPASKNQKYYVVIHYTDGSSSILDTPATAAMVTPPAKKPKEQEHAANN